MTTEDFLTLLFEYYEKHSRAMPWRNIGPKNTVDPYVILVSEIMLQQTQVDRVIPKFESFMQKFPTLSQLANVSRGEVLAEWIGLGYNRRATYLHDLAVDLHAKKFPQTINDLTKYKGIGSNTAAAILTYAYDQKHIFIETNIRTVILHHFFQNKEGVSDKALLEKLDLILQVYKGSYREFYWALMDYGTYLKRTGIKAHVWSSSYKRQKKFEGSVRQLRGLILKAARSHEAVHTLNSRYDDERLSTVIDALIAEKMIEILDGHLFLYGVRS